MSCTTQGLGRGGGGRSKSGSRSAIKNYKSSKGYKIRGFGRKSDWHTDTCMHVQREVVICTVIPSPGRDPPPPYYGLPVALGPSPQRPVDSKNQSFLNRLYTNSNPRGRRPIFVLTRDQIFGSMLISDISPPPQQQSPPPPPAHLNDSKQSRGSGVCMRIQYTYL